MAHRILKTQHEPEFTALTKLFRSDADLLIADIGANIGQSGLDFAALFPRARIVSFEANPELEPYLRFCQRLIGERFQFKMVGMSDSPRNLEIFVPKRGEVFIYGEAAVDAKIFEDAATRGRIGEFTLHRVNCRLIDFDSAGLSPDIVKIDVQGHELQVLQGMQRTLTARRPHLVIERSPADETVMAFLRPFGYDFFLAGDGGPPVPYSAQSARINMLCVPRAQN